MDKRFFSVVDPNTKAIIDGMASQSIHIMEEIVSNNEVLTSKLAEWSVTNGSNLMDMAI